MADPKIEAEQDRPKSKKIGALRGLVPFLAPYKGMIAAALVALVRTWGRPGGRGRALTVTNLKSGHTKQRCMRTVSPRAQG